MSEYRGVQPLNGFILVKPDELPKNVSKIVLPEQNALRPHSGKVVAAAPELETLYPVGTRLLFSEHSGELYAIDEESLKVLHKTEIEAWIAAGVEVEA